MAENRVLPAGPKQRELQIVILRCRHLGNPVDTVTRPVDALAMDKLIDRAGIDARLERLGPRYIAMLVKGDFTENIYVGYQFVHGNSLTYYKCFGNLSLEYISDDPTDRTQKQL